jgi:hypothetical protein
MTCIRVISLRNHVYLVRQGRTPLMVATILSSMSVVEIVLEAGSDVNYAVRVR